MKNDRRLALQFGAVNVASLTMPVTSRLALGVVGRYGVMRLGAKVLIPLGVFTVSPSAQAHPALLFGLILGMFAGAAAAKSSLSAELSKKDSWMERPVGSVNDFHDFHGAKLIAKPEHRGSEPISRSLGVDTSGSGALGLVGAANQGSDFRRDMTDEEFQALLRFGAILPKSDRKPPSVTYGSSEMATEMWRQMHGATAKPNPMSYMREYSDFKGNSYIGASHLEPGSNKANIWVGKVSVPMGS